MHRQSPANATGPQRTLPQGFLSSPSSWWRGHARPRRRCCGCRSARRRTTAIVEGPPRRCRARVACAQEHWRVGHARHAEAGETMATLRRSRHSMTAAPREDRRTYCWPMRPAGHARVGGSAEALQRSGPAMRCGRQRSTKGWRARSCRQAASTARRGRTSPAASIRPPSARDEPSESASDTSTAGRRRCARCRAWQVGGLHSRDAPAARGPKPGHGRVRRASSRARHRANRHRLRARAGPVMRAERSNRSGKPGFGCFTCSTALGCATSRCAAKLPRSTIATRVLSSRLHRDSHFRLDNRFSS